MVPSWTETLIHAKANIVGRTKFCIHPKTEIPIVGGTKDLDWEKVISLKPDILILDREENPKMMSEQTDISYFASHVKTILDMPRMLTLLSKEINNRALLQYAEDWEQILTKERRYSWAWNQTIPGILEWGKKPNQEIERIIYIIWKNPWMTVSSDTFIGSVLDYCGLNKGVKKYDEKYPQIDLDAIEDPSTTLLLFSSEPYPFLNDRKGLENLPFPHAFVDGECFSWFGIRSFNFLKNI